MTRAAAVTWRDCGVGEGFQRARIGRALLIVARATSTGRWFASVTLRPWECEAHYASERAAKAAAVALARALAART